MQLPAAKYNEVCSMFASGLSDGEIARRSGVSQSTVSRWHRSPTPPDQIRRATTASSWRAEGAAYVYLLGVYLGDGTVCHQPPGHWGLQVINDRRYRGISAEILGRSRPSSREPPPGCGHRRSASPTSCTSPTRPSRGRSPSTARVASTSARSS
ncbi:MAG: helix-turn-helix domain-containing protein [Solirubrobacterales bacterium]|nr:helix-turn-helix domain-containing protein [Solirubrobacterales bacterium]